MRKILDWLNHFKFVQTVEKDVELMTHDSPPLTQEQKDFISDPDNWF